VNAEVITSHISDIEEPRYQPLLEKVALRNLEEMVVTNQIDSDAIPLLKAIIGQNLPTGTTDSFVKQRFNKELILSVQTEVNDISFSLLACMFMGDGRGSY